MMPIENDNLPQIANVSETCWRQIGVDGDRSCPKLAEAVHCRNCPIFAAAGQSLLDRDAPSGHRDESTRRVALVEEAAPAEMVSLLVFRVGSEWLAIEAGIVVEVVEPRPIHRIPHRTNRLLLGLANIRGELHLCASLRDLLDVSESEAAAPAQTRQRLLVIEQGHDRWVFPVDEVEGVHRIPAQMMESLPHTVQRSAKYCSQAIFALGGRRVGMLAASRLFQALEKIAQ